ncbi:cell division protein FtsH [Bdellovibrio sp. qaytius]|nr:cell division protein FtsH [Bdellovibrio sp. qaytius]
MDLNEKAENKGIRVVYILWAIFIIFSIQYYTKITESETISYSEFLQLVDKGEVKDIVLSERLISGEILSAGKPSKQFRTVTAPDQTLIEKLHSKNISFRAERPSSTWGFMLAWAFPLLFLYWIWKSTTSGLGQRAGGLLSFTKSRAKIYVEKDVKTTFEDVAGVDEAKNELAEIVNFLQQPERYSRLGGRAPKGVLLVGPPGTGKTLLARAVAGEAKVPFFSINGSEFVEMFVGLGAARVRDFFEQARAQAPCILFIDEIDALGKSRALGFTSMGANDEKEQTLNQLLAEMDGFDPTAGIIMLAATNRPEILDPALLRAGRFDRQALLNKPDQIGREKILLVHVKKIKLDASVNMKNIASLTSGFSGADLANLVNEAALVATRRNAEAANEADFGEALERLVAGIEHKGKVMNQKEKQRIAYHELGHATVAIDLSASDKVYKVSIIPRSIGALGYTMQRPTEDRYVIDEDEIMRKIAVLLGGRASEKLFLEITSTGAADDLAKATDLARSMVSQFGMSDKLGMVSLESRSMQMLHSPLESRLGSVSEATAALMDSEVKKILDRAFDMATESLIRHKSFIEVAHLKLIQQETLSEQELLDLWQNSKTIFLNKPEPALDH